MKIKWIERGPKPSTDDLAGKSYPELKQLAKEKGVPGYARMSIEALRAALGGE